MKIYKILFLLFIMNSLNKRFDLLERKSAIEKTCNEINIISSNGNKVRSQSLKGRLFIFTLSSGIRLFEIDLDSKRYRLSLCDNSLENSESYRKLITFFNENEYYLM